MTPLTSLTTNAGGTTALNGGTVTTTGAQTYNDAVTLGADTTLTSTGGGALTLGSTVNGAQNLTLNTAGLTTLLGAVGGTTPLTTLTTNAGGTTGAQWRHRHDDRAANLQRCGHAGRRYHADQHRRGRITLGSTVNARRPKPDREHHRPTASWVPLAAARR